MRILATAAAVSVAPAADFYERWIDHSTWSEWSPDSEWVTVDGPVAVGTRGTLKPRSGPKVRFVITELVPGRTYTDTSRLPGARLTFAHHATPVDAARSKPTTRLDVEVRLEGPLALLWSLILGAGFRASAPADLQRLIRLVESARV